MCAVYTRFEANIRGLKNFSSAWISRSTNYRTSNIIDHHAKSDQHKASMMCLCAEQVKSKQLSVTSYSPIARSLLSTGWTGSSPMTDCQTGVQQDQG